MAIEILKIYVNICVEIFDNGEESINYFFALEPLSFKSKLYFNDFKSYDFNGKQKLLVLKLKLYNSK